MRICSSSARCRLRLALTKTLKFTLVKPAAGGCSGPMAGRLQRW